MKRRKNRQQGFSLIELMVVIAIIGTLATLVTMAMGSNIKKANQTSAQANCKTIKNALGLYRLDCKSYPDRRSSSTGS